jgi:hypothetical protein
LLEIELPEAPARANAILDLRAAGKRIGDVDLMSVIRRVSRQAASDAQRCAAAEEKAAKAAEQIEILTRQRDEALVQCRTGSPARLARMAEEVKRAVQQRNDAILERDEARAAWDKLRIEVANLRLGSPQGVGAKPAEPAKKKPPPDALLNIPPVEPGPAETALLAKRAVLVEQQQRLQDEAKKLGKVRGADARAKLVLINEQLAAFAPAVKAFKAARHAELMARQAQALRVEAEKLVVTIAAAVPPETVCAVHETAADGAGGQLTLSALA